MFHLKVIGSILAEHFIQINIDIAKMVDDFNNKDDWKPTAMKLIQDIVDTMEALLEMISHIEVPLARLYDGQINTLHSEEKVLFDDLIPRMRGLLSKSVPQWLWMVETINTELNQDGVSEEEKTVIDEMERKIRIIDTSAAMMGERLLKFISKQKRPENSDDDEDYSADGTFTKYERDLLLGARGWSRDAKYAIISGEGDNAESKVYENGQPNDEAISIDKRQKMSRLFNKAKRAIDRLTKRQIKIKNNLCVVWKLPSEVEMTGVGGSRQKHTFGINSITGEIEVDDETTKATRYVDREDDKEYTVISVKTITDKVAFWTALVHEDGISADAAKGLSVEEQHLKGLEREELLLKAMKDANIIDEITYSIEMERIEDQKENINDLNAEKTVQTEEQQDYASAAIIPAAFSESGITIKSVK
ncbi:MAG: hypothetical protein KAR20_25975, partial [Candidatus Heimdallarchaeota archaeon]|nr:hypothetical protein [Candidatus Heimdallarchaeota archaeon]